MKSRRHLAILKAELKMFLHQNKNNNFHFSVEYSTIYITKENLNKLHTL